MHEEVFVQDQTTVVYIEADRANALLMQVLLGSRAHYVLHQASDGLSGLELCRRVRPDLVILEMHLPDVNAHEVLCMLRDDPATERASCIVFSGDAMPAHIEQALAAGFDDYWIKPIDIWQLMQNIEEAAINAPLKFRRRQRAPVPTMRDSRARRYGVVQRQGVAERSSAW